MRLQDAVRRNLLEVFVKKKKKKNKRVQIRVSNCLWCQEKNSGWLEA